MVQPAPPSPAPSNGEYRQLSSKMNATANTSHPRDGLPLPHKIYPHPHPKFVNGAGFVAQDPSHLYSQQTNRMPMGGYPVERGVDNNYGPLPGEVGYNVQPPYTPEASPPTPSPAHSMATRSGLNISKSPLPTKTHPVKGGRVTKNTKDAKHKKTASILSKPLSEIAKDFPHVAVADIAAFVSRSAEQRLQETSRNKKAGQVKRPMNAFMLYRKAYQEVAKTQCTHNNHQLVSKVCGVGWPMESDEVHEQFTEWAKMERTNHQQAHPGYKFTPSKPRKGRLETDGESTIYSDIDDPEWGSPHRFPRQTARRPGTRQVSRLSETPSLGYEPFIDAIDAASTGGYHDMYPYAIPGRSDTVPYGQIDPCPYDPRLQYPPVDGMPHIMARHTSPGLEYAARHIDADVELLGNYYRGIGHVGDPFVEGSFSGGLLYGGVAGDLTLTAENAWHLDPHVEGSYETGPVMGELIDMSAQDAYLRGKNDDWKVQELDEAGQFEDWIVQTEQGLL